MKEYKLKDLSVKALKYDGTNASEIASTFAGFESVNGVLKDKNGTIVSNGQWVIEFDGGFTKIMTDLLFQHLFDEVLPPKYTLAGIADIKNCKLRRASWNENCYIHYFSSVFFLNVGSDEETPYNLSADDLQADDWMVL